MDIEYLQNTYKHSEWNYKPNKIKFPITYFNLSERDEFNEIFSLIKTFCHHVEATKSGAIPNKFTVRDVCRYITIESNTGIELSVASIYGCWRFIILKGDRNKRDNSVSGQKALKEVLNTAKNFGVLDTFIKSAKDKEEAMQEKADIEHPIILTNPSFHGKEFENVHHLDLNSSYASRIAEVYPELRPMYEYLYNHRKDNDGYYKHVLTNSIGCMQSQYCLNPNIVNTDYEHWNTPFALSTFAKTAINETNKVLMQLGSMLEKSGRELLLYNTDGIWYKGDVYHNIDEGKDLCQWKNDHINCKLFIKSAGAYQYEENGKVYSVVRGTTSLDYVKPREDWKWREIEDYSVVKFVFDNDKGVQLTWED